MTRAILMLGLAMVLTGFAAMVPGRAAADRRVALVIGNARYASVLALKNPANDAADIAAALRRLGFAVTEEINASYREMRLALRDFAEAAERADMALVYFAGHGIEIDKTNYLIPVNAELKSDRDVEFEAISLDAVLRSVAASGGLRIVLVDACRNNPFSQNMSRTIASRSLGRGLARVDPVGGVLVGYAAREGTIALDGDGRNSPYARALLRHIEEPGLEIGKLFRRVRDTVFEMTNGQQEPFTYGSLPGIDIYLKPPLAAPAPEGLEQIAAAPVDGAEAQIIADYAAAAEKNTLRAWADFADRYGALSDHALVQLAVARRDSLQRDQAARSAEQERDPWLVPKAGLPKFGPVELDREERKLVQEALLYMGFDPGPIDGQFGPKTRTAIAAASYRIGTTASGKIDRRFLKALPNVPATRALRSDLARQYDKVELPDDIDPRLHKALAVLKHRKVLFDYFEGNLYVVVEAQGFSGWGIANNYASRAGGHLVTIGSAAENRFLVSLFSRDSRFVRDTGGGYVHGPMIGLVQIDRSREPFGGWAWVTGEPLVYKNWSRGNPDNHEGNQQNASFFGTASQKNRPIYWDDNSWTSNHYIIEIE